MPRVLLPSVRVDSVSEDFLASTQGTVLSGVAGPFVLADGQTLDVDVDGGGDQTVTFNAVDFDNIALATSAEVAQVLNSVLVGAVSVEEGGKVRITSEVYGASSSIEISGGTAAGAFSFPGGAQSGADAAATLVVANRIPEPEEIRVPLASHVMFDLMDSGGTVPAQSEVTVDIGGVTAFDGASGFVNGFSGAVTNPDAATLRFDIVPPAFFADSVQVGVDVVVATPALSESWSFLPVDETPPLIASVVAQDKQRIRVTFNEPIKLISPAATDDGLNPANYQIERRSIPAVAVVVTGVTRISDTVVDLATDIELTFNARYEAIVSVAVVDAEGNPFAGSANSYIFYGFVPPFPKGRRFLLSDFFRFNLSEDTTGELRLQLAVLQEVVNLLLCMIDEWSDILDIDLAPDSFLDAMMGHYGGDVFVRFGLNDADKRRLARVLVAMYRLKGTGKGVIDLVRFFLGFDVTLVIFNGIGWRLGHVSDVDSGDALSGPSGEVPGSGPAATLGPDRAGLYTFKVVSPQNLTYEQASDIIWIADFMKPAHTHLAFIEQPNAPTFSLLGLDVPVVGVDGPEVDHLQLGRSGLGSDVAGYPGNWKLH